MDALKKLHFHANCSEARIASVHIAANEWLEGAETLTLHTSGSTGSPKAWTMKRAHILHSIRDTAEAFQLGSDSRSALAMDMAGTGGKLMLWRALELGMHLQILPVERTLDWEGPLDFMALVPQQALALSAEQAKSIRTLLLGGAPIRMEEEKQLSERFSEAYHGFGMTETLSHIALRKLGVDAHYTCLPGVEVSLEAGALVIDAPNRGVHALKTTDAAEVHDGHSFTWLGRLDGAILSGGKKIFPEAIDQAVAAAYPESPAGFAGSMADDQWGEALVWYSEPLTDEARQKLEEAFLTLASWKRPKKIIVGPLPLTASGKWKRR